MRHLSLALCVLCLTLPLSSLVAAATVTLPNCVLSPDADVLVPAQESGVLISIPVREGQQVTKGELLAQIDDLVPRRQLDVAQFKLEVAKKQATDKIDIVYAEAGYRFAGEVRRDRAANEKYSGSVSIEVVDEHELEREKFRLSIDKAKKDLDVNGLQQQVSEAELEATRAMVERRRITAPIDGVVLDLARHEGEWVEPGQKVMRLVRIDLLRVDSYLSAKDHRPADIEDRPVQVVVTLPGGQRETFPGRIVYVKTMVQGDGFFQVRAELQNRKQGGAWVLNPGLPAEMTIQLK